jgi:hypothetical protein
MDSLRALGRYYIRTLARWQWVLGVEKGRVLAVSVGLAASL